MSQTVVRLGAAERNGLLMMDIVTDQKKWLLHRGEWWPSLCLRSTMLLFCEVKRHGPMVDTSDHVMWCSRNNKKQWCSNPFSEN